MGCGWDLLRKGLREISKMMVMYCILIGGWVRQMGAFVNTQQNTLTICAFYVGSTQKYVKQILSSS